MRPGGDGGGSLPQEVQSQCGQGLWGWNQEQEHTDVMWSGSCPPLGWAGYENPSLPQRSVLTFLATGGPVTLTLILSLFIGM